MKDIVGKYEGKNIGSAGNLILFLQSAIGIATFLSLICLLFVIDYFLKKLHSAENAKMNHLAELIGYTDLIVQYEEKQPFDQIIIKYLGVTYVFDENGLIEKQTTEKEALTKEDAKLIKTVIINDQTKEYTYSTQFVLEDTQKIK